MNYVEPIKGLDRLRAAYPWPKSVGDGPRPPTISLDGGGRPLIIELAKQTKAKVLLEVGAFLGGSALTWLRYAPDLTVIVSDIWNWDAATYVRGLIGKSEWGDDAEFTYLAALLDQHGMYGVAQLILRDYRERVVLLKMPLAQAYERVGSFLTPDLVYIDANKERADYFLAHERFPYSIICGDDWTWRDEKGARPVRGYVHEIAGLRGCDVVSDAATWVIAPKHLQLMAAR